MGSTVVSSAEKPQTILNVTAQLGTAKKPTKTFGAILTTAHTPSATAPVTPSSANTSTTTETASKSEEVKTSEAGTLTSGSSSTSCPCQDSGSLAINISFFVRLSGEFEQAGSGVQTLFHRAARLVSDIFQQEQGWVGDPIGQFLNVSETASAKGAPESSSFFEQLMSKAQSGFQQMTQFLGATPLPKLTSGTTPTASSWFNPTYGTDMGNLQLSSATTARTTAPVRIPEYNRNGGKLYLISNDEAEQIRQESKLGRVLSDSRDKSVRFMEAFNNFLDNYIAEDQSTESTASDSSQDQTSDAFAGSDTEATTPAPESDQISDSSTLV